MKKALGLDYDEFEKGGTVFDYDALMKATNYTPRRDRKDTVQNRCRRYSAAGAEKHFRSGKKICKAWLRRKNPG